MREHVHDPLKNKTEIKHSSSRRDEDCAPGGIQGQISTERNRYYTGKYMVARDFQDEQFFFLSRHQLHLRLFHGTGVVCGLKILEHPNPNCSDYVIVTPGIAIDCYGREIILKKTLAVRLWKPANPEPPDEEAGPAGKQAKQSSQHHRPETSSHAPTYPALGDEATPSRVLVYLQYREELTEYAPVLYSEDACAADARAMEAGRVREIAYVDALPWDLANSREYAGCWPGEPDEEHGPCWKGCGDTRDEILSGCLDPVCTCQLGVPLAMVNVEADGEKLRRKDPDAIDMKGRPSLAPPEEHLTRIIGVNWTHGDTMTLAELSDPHGRNGKLKIYFDRPLKERPRDDEGNFIGNASGINEMTFMVQTHTQQDVRYEVEILSNDAEPPYWDEEECAAVFPIDRRSLDDRYTLVGKTLHITLKCDFISDCNDQRVAGNFRGEFPTHGPGTFESWFVVTADKSDTPRRWKMRQEAS
jgi:hypothetical protein